MTVHGGNGLQLKHPIKGQEQPAEPDGEQTGGKDGSSLPETASAQDGYNKFFGGQN